jgi:hypothetical protein
MDGTTGGHITMSKYKYGNEMIPMLFADEDFPDISPFKTAEENRKALNESSDRMAKEIDEEFRRRLDEGLNPYTMKPMTRQEKISYKTA